MGAERDVVTFDVRFGAVGDYSSPGVRASVDGERTLMCMREVLAACRVVAVLAAFSFGWIRGYVPVANIAPLETWILSLEG